MKNICLCGGNVQQGRRAWSSRDCITSVKNCTGNTVNILILRQKFAICIVVYNSGTTCVDPDFNAIADYILYIYKLGLTLKITLC